MAVDAELAAIIGGSVAGAIILIAIIAVIVFLCCGKRRQKKDREQKKFQQLTPHTSPSHSQPSSLGHGNPPGQDPRLPKVGSNGLWLGTPGIYAGTPSPAYYYGRPGGKMPHPNSHLMQPAVLQRASSETRIPQRDRQGYLKYHVPERRAASLQRGLTPTSCVPGGPGIYAATGGSQQRIYHSQQLASLTPLYEVVDPRNGSVYDVYQIGGGSKTKLLQQDGGDRDSRSIDRHSKSNKKVQRSQSDAAREASKRPHRPKSAHEGQHRFSKNGSITKETAQVHEPKTQTTTTPANTKEMGRENPAFVGSSEKISGEVKEALATDSMKLLAKNKTDDQKKVVNPSSDTESKEPAPVPAQDPSLHYTYGGDIYAVPHKEDSKRRSRSENPILARMQDMILERAEGSEPGQVSSDPVTDLSKTAEPLIVTSVYANPDQGASLIQNPIYQEVEEVAVATEREAVGSSSSTGLARTEGDLDITREVAATVQLAADELDGGARNVEHGDVVVDDMAAASAVTSLRDAGSSGGGVKEEERGEVVKEALDTRWSVDTDAATDEISRAGKHISVTAEAFEFLDTYLSDEDGADSHSPPKSPMLSGGDELMY